MPIAPAPARKKKRHQASIHTRPSYCFVQRPMSQSLINGAEWQVTAVILCKFPFAWTRVKDKVGCQAAAGEPLQSL